MNKSKKLTVLLVMVAIISIVILKRGDQEMDKITDSKLETKQQELIEAEVEKLKKEKLTKEEFIKNLTQKSGEELVSEFQESKRIIDENIKEYEKLVAEANEIQNLRDLPSSLAEELEEVEKRLVKETLRMQKVAAQMSAKLRKREVQ